MDKIIKSYKGFNKDMTCKGFQYEEGKEYETDNVNCCNSGFHEVEQSGELSYSGGDSKVASGKIKIGTSLSIADIVQAAIEYTTERSNKENDSTLDYGASSATGYCGASSVTGDKGVSSATGDKGVSSATGDYGASSATGDYGASSATGYKGASLATGDYGASSATGDCGVSSATGDKGTSSATGTCGVSSVTGDYGASSATGYKGASLATGDYGASSATGDCGVSSATGDKGTSSATGTCGVSSVTGYKGASSSGNKDSVAVAWGYKSKARGVLGSYLVLADWDGNKNRFNKPSEWTLKGAKMVRVDGDTIKENVWYTMRNGEIVEADDSKC